MTAPRPLPLMACPECRQPLAASEVHDATTDLPPAVTFICQGIQCQGIQCVVTVL